MLRRLALVAGIAALVAPAAHPFPRVAGCARADFDGVRAARCGTASGARAVVVLHGCGGFSTFDHRLAEELPRYGISTLYVDYFEPSPFTLAEIARLPPSIFLDGGSHDIVPAANARALYAAAVAAHVPSALYVYGNGSHGWPGEQGTAGIARAAAFLVRRLH